MISKMAIDWLQAAVNAALALDPETHEKLSSMSGRVISIRMEHTGAEFYLFPDADGITIKTDYKNEADTVISGTPVAILKMGLNKQTAPLLLKNEVSIEGDTRLGREFKKILAGLDIDWEEFVSKMIGDAPAHQLFKTLDSVRRWGRKSARSVTDDVSEYLQEESRDVVSGAELDYFYQQVDELRDAVARMEINIAQLSGLQEDTKE